MRAQPVERANRRLGIRHADVDVQRAHRIDDRIAEQGRDEVVASLVGDVGLALPRGRVNPRPQPARLPRRARRRAAGSGRPSPPWRSDTPQRSIRPDRREPRARPAPGAKSGSASSTCVPALSWRPAESTRNSSCSTPSVKASVEPKAGASRPGSVISGDRQACGEHRAEGARPHAGANSHPKPGTSTGLGAARAAQLSTRRPRGLQPHDSALPILAACSRAACTSPASRPNWPAASPTCRASFSRSGPMPGIETPSTLRLGDSLRFRTAPPTTPIAAPATAVATGSTADFRPEALERALPLELEARDLVPLDVPDPSLIARSRSDPLERDCAVRREKPRPTSRGCRFECRIARANHCRRCLFRGWLIAGGHAAARTRVLFR